MNREEFNALSLDERMRIMKFYQSAKHRWMKLYNKELTLDKYLSWLIPPKKEMDEVDLSWKSKNLF